MTKQTFEVRIVNLIDSTTGVGTEVTDEGTIGVGVMIDEVAVKTEARRLYDELTATQPDSVDPHLPEPLPDGAGDDLEVSLDLTEADVSLPLRPMIVANIDSRDTFFDRVIVDVEAWRDGKQAAQTFMEDVTVAGPVDLTFYLNRLQAGSYQLKAFIFKAPKNEGEPWGKKLWGNEDAGTFTVTAAEPYISTKPNTASYARLPQQVDQYVGQYPELKAIADQPTGVWLGMEWVPDAEKRGQEIVAHAGDLPPLIVVYSIPNRDTGEYSHGGAKSPEAYHAWIDALAKGVGDHPAIYILEPDALGHLDKLTEEQKQTRTDLLGYAAAALREKTLTHKVYIDASMWVQPEEMAKRIKAVEGRRLHLLDGFSINTSNYKKLSVCKEYGDALSKLTGLPYLIDTSRNGIGTDADDGRWCNLPGQTLGEAPDLQKGYAWVKAPGESDGLENGGPAAGEFWLEGALALVKNGRA